MVEIINDSSPPEMCFRTISKNHLTMVADSNMFDPVYVKIRNKYNDVLLSLLSFSIIEENRDGFYTVLRWSRKQAKWQRFYLYLR
jgi:hypothetical protein